jgi:hypothetical protein
MMVQPWPILPPRRIVCAVALALLRVSQYASVVFIILECTLVRLVQVALLLFAHKQVNTDRCSHSIC